MTASVRYRHFLALPGAFGNGLEGQVIAFLYRQGIHIGSQGHNVTRLLVPLSAQDFTPFAQQVKQANPDLLFIAWAGTTGPAMYRALTQQGVFGVSRTAPIAVGGYESVLMGTR